MAKPKIKPGVKHPTKPGLVMGMKGRWVAKSTYNRQVKASRKGGPLTKTKTSAIVKAQKGGKLTKTNPKSSAIVKAQKGGKLTKQKSRALVKTKTTSIVKSKKPSTLTIRNNKLAKSETANTSKDTVKAKGTRTGKAGKVRRLLKAAKTPKPPKTKTTLKSRVRNFVSKQSAKRWLKEAKSGKGAVNRAIMSSKGVRGGNLASILISGALDEKVVKPVGKYLGTKLSFALSQTARKIAGKKLLTKKQIKIIKDGIEAGKSKEEIRKLVYPPKVKAEIATKVKKKEEGTNKVTTKSKEQKPEPKPEPKTKLKKKPTLTKAEIAARKEKKAKTAWLKSTRNSPAQRSRTHGKPTFSKEELWKLRKKHQDWKKRTGRK